MSDCAPDNRQPSVGDYVVVRGSILPSGARVWDDTVGWVVIEWGVVPHPSVDQTHPRLVEAQAHARMLALTHRRPAWDASGPTPVPLPRAPLIYRLPGGLYSVSAVVTGEDATLSSERWQSVTGLTEAEARAHLASVGFPGAFGAALLAVAAAQRTGQGV